MSNLFVNGFNEVSGTIVKTKDETISLVEDIKKECLSFDVFGGGNYVKENFHTWFYIPFLPAFHRPGWLLRYIVGPHNVDLFESAFFDVWAGITVALTLIPQALSYARLANLPAINGLYTAVLPSATYTFFGSSMQLGVGPVALVSLLMGQLVIQYDVVAFSQESVELAGEAAVCVGLFLSVMSILNLGNFIRFISHPVMSGFTTAAAMLIGLNQLKNAFGITIDVPQQGQEGYEYNWQVMKWFVDHWNDEYKGEIIQNHYAIAICFGLFIPLILIQMAKNTYKPNEATKKSFAFRTWNILSSLTPFIGIIIGARVAYLIHKHDNFFSVHTKHEYFAKNLKIVGKVTPGLDILRSPSMKWDFGQLMGDTFPLTLIAFMESYSVAHRIATKNNELHILNANQEMWAIGIANFMASVSSAYPVAGSFSRSSLNDAAGAKTPLSKATTMIVVVLSLRFLTKTFQYIPQAALAAIIWTAIYNLVNFTDFWHAWKHSKKDFLTMLVTAITVFVADTGVGLAVGLGFSVLVILGETAFSSLNSPVVITSAKTSPDRIDHVVLRSDLNFITSGRFVDTVSALTLLEPESPHATNSAWGDRIFYNVSSFLDRWLKPAVTNPVSEVPNAIVLDFKNVIIVDLTALQTIEEMVRVSRKAGAKVVIINTSADITAALIKFNISNDMSSDKVDLDSYLAQATLPFVKEKAVEITPAADDETVVQTAEVEKETFDAVVGYTAVPVEPSANMV